MADACMLACSTEEFLGELAVEIRENGERSVDLSFRACVFS